MEGERMACCGCWELDGLAEHANPTAALKDLFEGHPPQMVQVYKDGYYKDTEAPKWAYPRLRTDFPAFMVFTQARRGSTYGERFARYIKRSGLGKVVRTKGATNPNTGNQVVVFVWTVNQRALLKARAKWWKERNKGAD